MAFNTSFAFFAIVGGALALIDAKREVIPDKIILPSILLLATIMYFEKRLHTSNVLTLVGVAIFFVIVIYFFDDFGGGDIRFGAFCGLFLGFPNIFIFFVIGGILQIAALLLLSKKTVGFAPAMYASAIITAVFADKIWGLI